MPTAADLAQTVVMTATVELPPMEIEKTVKAMLDHGSRYRNMEKALGTGICLVLGCYLPESYWKKLMKKSGALFDSVIAHIKQTEAMQLAADYSPLQEAIVRQTMMALMQERSPYSAIIM